LTFKIYMELGFSFHCS